ncbi:type II secretion system F family protein [bacterium]|nr:MAG: type II secretion system F family protein [bacterium]
MPNYTYQARDMSGAISSGEIFAEDEAGLRAHLRDSRLFLVGYKKGSEAVARNQPAARSRKKVKLVEMAIASRQLATLVRAGLPIVETLSTLRAQVDNPSLAQAVGEMQTDVVGGTTLSESMRKHPKIFNGLCVALVAAGEAGGLLDVTLDIMAEQLDKESLIQQQIKSAMAYPKLVVGACVGVVSFMLVFIVPVFGKMYEQFGAELPFATLALVAVSNFITKSWWLAAILIYVLIRAMKAFRATKFGKRLMDTIALKAPIFGPIMRKIAIARFAQTFAGLSRSGVPILNALAICADTAGNVIIYDAVMHTASQVSEGSALAPTLEETGQFPPMVTKMIGAGEKSGNLDEMLDEVGKFYGRDVDFAIQKMTKLIEPLMTMVVGGVVLLILLALYMPVFNLTQVMKR